MKALITLGYPRIAVIYSSKFSEVWWKIEVGVSGQLNTVFFLLFKIIYTEISFPYLLDMAAIV